MKKKKLFLEIFSLLCVAALFFTIYVFVELRSSKLCVIGSCVVLLITAYLLIDFIIDLKSESSDRSGLSGSSDDVLTARLDELESVEKAIYTATKRNGSDASALLGSLSTSLESIENQLSFITSSLAPDADLSVNVRRLLSAEQSIHEIIQYIRQDQQNGVKMGIKYNKENARQLAEIDSTNTDKLAEISNTNTDKLIEINNSATDKLVAKLESLEAALRSGITVSGTVERSIPVVEPEPAPVAEVPAPEPEPEPVVEAPAPEPEPEPVVEIPDIEIPESSETTEETMSDDDLAKLLESLPDVPEEAVPEPEPVVEAPAPEPEPIVEAPAPEPEPAPAAGPSLDELMSGDPNKALSPDEIAAMFAAASNAAPAPEPEPVVEAPEPEPEPIVEAPAPEPAPAAGPSLDELMSGDPNKALSPDEIAAMFAAASAAAPAPEPVVEAPAPEPEPAPSLESLMSGDPNKALSPEEIAAMFAAAGK